MALAITELKKGTLIQLNGQPYKVVDYSQKVMGRGGSIVSTRLKNLMDGSVVSRTFQGNERIESADVMTTRVQYLYRDDSNYYFMDSRTYDQFSVPGDVVSDISMFLKEGADADAQHFGGRVIAIELPIKVTLQVIDAEPGIKGDTVSNAMKSATLETGAKIQVPLFVNSGDSVIVDTRNSSYVERAR